jgi:hypothetical protein
MPDPGKSGTLAVVLPMLFLAGCEGRVTALKVTRGDASAGAASDSFKDVPKVGTYQVELTPTRLLDLVFLIDNSLSMAPKQQKLRENFPRLITALRNPIDGTLPDLRVAIITSDLGTNGVIPGGGCGSKMLADGTLSSFGDRGRFQMIGAEACGITDAKSLWLEYANDQPMNFKGDISTVFACLAGNVGTIGCGEEQPLQAFEFALAAKGIGNDNQQAMLRAKAKLGLVFLSDEDDCSIGNNNGIFQTAKSLQGESTSLRCATRAHACAGSNLTQSPPGFPTNASFEAPLSTCVARTDACPNAFDGTGTTDTSQPTDCSPARNVKPIADAIKRLKEKPDEQIFVVGIFGWPNSEADMATTTYKIAPVHSEEAQLSNQQTIYAAWPVCYDANHKPINPDPNTGYDEAAAGWGAIAGLRLSAFVDEFADNGLKFSICQRDYSDSMQRMGGTLVRKMQNLCLPASFANYGSCTVNYLKTDSSGKEILDSNVIPLCAEQPDTVPCYSVGTNTTLCPGDNYYVELNRGSDAASPLPAGLKLAFSCR